MSYETLAGGGIFGGFGYEGLSGTFPVQSENEGIREVQQELQRLGYMPAGQTIYGADGRFGPRTATALRAAARYVGWTDAPYTPSNAAELRSGSVDIPEDLISRLKSAVPNPNAPHGDGSPEPAAPSPSTSSSSSSNALLLQSEGRSGGTGWLPAAIMGGGALLVGGWFIYAQRKKKKPKRNRRRRTSRR